MKKGILLINMVLFSILSYTQPYIVTNQGLGMYGYVESSAVTWVRLNTNAETNVDYMGARWWTGSEYIYNTSGLSCAGAGTEASTALFNHSNLSGWVPGEIAYVSVNTAYCGGGTWNQQNERQFREVEVVTTGYGGAIASNVDNNLNLVGTFVINTGATALTLDRLWISTSGTAQEGEDLPNDQIKIYYENVTGSEVFGGDESNAILYGDYGGNSSTNEEFGHDDLNISISANTDLRVYIVVDNLDAGYTPGRTVQFSIINDGISFQEAMNTSFNLMRIDVTDISGSAISLPVELTKFNTTPRTNDILLSWETATEINNSHFEVEKSTNGDEFEAIGTVEGNGSTTELQSYSFIDENPVNGLNYYRLKQVDYDGTFEYSDVAVAEFKAGKQVSIYPNPARDELFIQSDINNEVNIAIYNVQGQLVRQMNNIRLDGQYRLNISDLTSGLYQVQLFDTNTNTILQQHRMIKQ